MLTYRLIFIFLEINGKPQNQKTLLSLSLSLSLSLTMSGSDSDSEPSTADSSEAHLMGFIIANIVGLRYYTGTVSGRELVVLSRQPLNPYDSNAIAVLNMRQAQVGHLERSVAATLAPLLDSHFALAEAIVPKPPGRNPKNPNAKPYRLPCQIHLFARPEAEEIVRVALEEGGLQLIQPNDHEFGLSQANIVAEDKNKKEKKRDLDKIFALVGNDERGKVSPMEPPKDVIVSELFQHQKEGLGWLFSREKSCDLPPFWEEKDGAYVNVLTNYTTQEQPQLLKGGIFADDMGLGKTLTLLSLIAATKTGGESSVVGDRNSSKKKRKRTNEDAGVSGSKVTLVVCPPSVFSSWITQLEEHTQPGSLKVYLYHGDRTKDKRQLLKFDIVLTTYSTLSTEFSDPNSPMKEIKWYRVILDEAHVIKNSAAQQTKAVVALKSERRWVVTGTPIQNSSFDLFSLMLFLRFQPFSIKSYWQSLIQRPLAQGSASGLSRLQALLGAISLRRTKDVPDGGESLVGLPPKTVETCLVELSAEERECYDKMESEAQSTVREFLDSDTVLRNYSTVLHIILRLRQICDDVALCPPDIKSLLPSNALEDVSNNPVLLKKLASLIEDGDDFDCPICLSPPIKTIITRCTHIFCQTCILKVLKNPISRCPICRQALSKADLFLAPDPPPPDEVESNPSANNQTISSKVATLLKFLQESKKQDQFIKSVVFSQFRKMLLLLEAPLKAAGFGVLRLDGTMTAKKRSEVIKEFSRTGPRAPTILLASLKAAGTGINLTAASRVYLMEPWWNPGVEEQAMDRVHRIGQQQEVKVVRLIVRNSIEERILELQEKKMKLAGGAFRRQGTDEQKRMRIEDLHVMMGL
ncbi:hypothetical protein LUZ62_086297 [Rhynchospora pubera]|uniref:SWI/SNF-related matrix-associated actin-dependent regulator of chromatin subfamily A member 3-like 1 n=1 Tax=Rhynchospora pubera TaxID=906938 RepID=A0AAV8CC31_9POAL|nr:hypothetical protein LUZ62_086297 [Rhynchospora pubera]